MPAINIMKRLAPLVEDDSMSAAEKASAMKREAALFGHRFPSA